MKKKKEKTSVSVWLYHKIPPSLRKRWDKLLAKSFRHRTSSFRADRIAMQEFQIGQIRIFLRGMLLLSGITLSLLIYETHFSGLSYQRNTFGQGEKEIVLSVDQNGSREDISLSLEEKTLTSDEEEKVFREFFKALKKAMLGKNSSLRSVNHALDFVDSVDSYPFSVTYEPEDISLVSLNGELGEAAVALKKGETASTVIVVEASYKDYVRQKRISVRVIPQETVSKTITEKFVEMLQKKESSSRQEEEFSISDSWKGLKIRDSSLQNLWKLPLFCIVILGLLLVRSHSALRDQDKIRHRENMEDFPLIVHLLTLYMGAGLSFSSAVERICNDYESTGSFTGKRYAFEQIRIMNHCLHMGLRPREVCIEWGDHFQEKIYAKFAMLLSQGFSKGAREIRSMMEKEQQDAFQVQVDYVRREGEEASTRLLFPMIVLLLLIMVLVMFPAIMQFSDF